MRIMGVQDLWRNAILDPRFARPGKEHTARYSTGSSRRLEEKWKHLVELDERMKLDPAEIEAEKHRIGYEANLLRKYAVNGSDSFE